MEQVTAEETHPDPLESTQRLGASGSMSSKFLAHPTEQLRGSSILLSLWGTVFRGFLPGRKNVVTLCPIKAQEARSREQRISTSCDRNRLPKRLVLVADFAKSLKFLGGLLA